MYLSDVMKTRLLSGQIRGPDSPFIIDDRGAMPSVRLRYNQIRFHTAGIVELYFNGQLIGSVRSPMKLEMGSTLILNGVDGSTAFQFD